MRRSNQNYIGTSRNLRSLGLAASSLFLILAIGVIAPYYIYVDSGEATTGTAIGSTLTFTSINPTASVSLSVSDPNGTFATSAETEKAKFTISTDNYTGYTLNISNTGSTVLKNQSGTGSLTMIDSAMSTISANNTWGILPNYYNSLENTSYIPVPASSVLLDKTTAMNAIAKEYTIALGAKADFTNTDGIYTSSSLVLEYIANPVTYSVTYNQNTTDTVTNMPTTNPQTGSVNGGTSTTSINFSNTTPARAGYDFLGWCDAATTSSAGVDSCSGTTYQPNDDYGIDQTANNTMINLYAMWSLKTVQVTVNFAGSGVSSVVFTNATYGDQTVSTNGGKVNLKYGVQYNISGTYAENYEFSSWSATDGTLGSSSNASTTYSTTTAETLTLTGKGSLIAMQSATYADCGKNMYDNRGTDAYKNIAYSTAKIGTLCWMTRNLDLPGGTTLTNSDSNITATSYSLPASSTSGFSSYTAQNVYNSGRTTCSNNSSTGSCYSYYTYAAATAGTNPSSGAASSDICPKGWRLPTQAEFNTLKGTYTTGAALTASPFYAVYGGDYSNSSFYNGGSGGYYWSSTARNANGAYYLYFNSSSVDVGNYNYKYYGISIRCVMKTMQDTTPNQFSANETKTLVDARDGSTYSVTKLGDYLWMVQNLHFDISTTAMTTELSNMAYAAQSSATSWSNTYTDPKIYKRDTTNYGYYYNYCAASAGTNCQSSSKTDSSATQNICPKGWHIPTQAEFNTITSQTSYFNLTGGYYSSSQLYSTSNGYWWSSTAVDASTQYRLYYYGSLNASSSDGKNSGISVRCVRTS